jgi:type I restriction enzyme S subunit
LTVTSGTTRKRISRKNLNKIQFSIPPLPEQERIVTRIEELFSQLDNGVETLQTIKRQLTVYRQAVLKKAFEGAYTADWRASHCDCSPMLDFESIKIAKPIFQDTSGDENEMDLLLPETWLKIRIGEVFKVDIGSTPSRAVSNYWNGTINWVSSGEVRFNNIYRSKEFITEDGLNNSSTNIQPVGTILLAMIGEGKTRGQAAILKVEAAHNQNTAAILVSETPCVPKYVYYFLYLNYENTRRVGSGNNQKALNKERVRALRFPFPSFAEQGQIVKEIESRLSVCENIEQTVDAALQQSEALRQSILKEAFEGRLI